MRRVVCDRRCISNVSEDTKCNEGVDPKVRRFPSNKAAGAGRSAPGGQRLTGYAWGRVCGVLVKGCLDR
jgi:hypothetical protein